DHISLPRRNSLTGIGALSAGHAGMKHRDPVSETLIKPPHRLICERDLRDQDDRLFLLREYRPDHIEIYLRFATACHAKQEIRFSLSCHIVLTESLRSCPLLLI